MTKLTYEGCLSPEQIHDYKSFKLYFSNGREISSHLKSCPLCKYVYDNAGSVNPVAQLAGLMNKTVLLIAESIPALFRRSAFKNSILIVISLVITHFVLTRIFNPGTKPEQKLFYKTSQSNLFKAAPQKKTLKVLAMVSPVKTTRPIALQDKKERIIKLNTDSILKAAASYME